LLKTDEQLSYRHTEAQKAYRKHESTKFVQVNQINYAEVMLAQTPLQNSSSYDVIMS